MTITVKFRRGNTSTSNGLVLANGELYIDTSKRTVVVHDGSTLGGNPLATEAALISGLSMRTTAEDVNTVVQTSISDLINSAPTALNTLNELATALGNDANYATTVTTALGTKQNTLVSGTNIKTINGTSILGSGDIVTSVPQEIWKKQVSSIWNYTVETSNYTSGSWATHPTTITLTPTKTGTLEIIYRPGDAYAFTNFVSMYLTFAVTTYNNTYSFQHAISNNSTGSIDYGPFIAHIPVVANSPISMNIGWWLAGYGGYTSGPLIYTYGNVDGSNRFITARYVNISNNTSTF